MPSAWLERHLHPVTVVAADTTVVEAARLMRDERVGCVIVGRNRRAIGILTDRDITTRVVAAGKNGETTPVKDVATFDPFVIHSSNSMQTAVDLMRKHGVRRLPVVDEDEIVVGIVTTDDLLVTLSRELASIGDAIADSSDACDIR